MATEISDSEGEVWTDTRIKFCIQESRCRLCSFGLKDGDEIVLGPRSCRILDSVWVTFRRGDVKIGEQAVLCCCCRDNCSNESVPVHCFHMECSLFAWNTFHIEDVPLNFLKGTRFGFAPPLWGELERQRAKRLSYFLAEKMKKEQWPRSLPNEVWRMITDNFVRECAIVTAYEQTLVPQALSSTINLSQDVYAEYTMFDGNRYLKTIRNPEDSNGHGDLVLRGQESGSIREVYVIDDHFGIRDLVFVSDKQRQLPSPSSFPLGTWIRRISAPLGVWRVGIECDGFRVRGASNPDFNAGHAFDIQHNARFRQWLSPQVTAFNIRSLKPRYSGFRQRSTSSRVFPQMDSFDCNVPGVIGYSAAVTFKGVVAICAHYNDSDFSMYGEVNPLFPVQWIYMPIDQGEFVTEICRFAGHILIGPRPYGLTFTTNRGRTGVFGGHFHLTEDPDFQKVYNPPNRPSTIFFNKGHDVTWLACEDLKPPVKREVPQSVIPITSIDLSPVSWHYSRCEMEGITRMIPCHKSDRHHKQLVGLLLEYEDGHRERLGEWRFDRAAEPIRVLDHSGSVRLKQMYEHICDKEVCLFYTMELVPADAPPTEGEDYDCYMDMPWHGIWEWWFGAFPLYCEHSHAEWLLSPQNGGETSDDEDEFDWKSWEDFDETWLAWFNDKSMPPWYEPFDDEFDEGSDVESD